MSVRFTLVFLVCLAGACTPSKGDKPNETSQAVDELESRPELGTLAIGGLPSLEEAGSLHELTQEEAEGGVTKVGKVPGHLAIELTAGEAAASLVEGECSESFFCFAKAFTEIYDMVTGAAECNFDLLLGDGVTPKQVGNHPVFIIDGFGTIGLGENGLTCPDKSAVNAFVERIKSGAQSDGDEFFLPTRLVLFKKEENRMDWRLVFFPADYMEKLSKRIPVFERLLDADLDFVGFSGSHDISFDVGKGDGGVVLNFDEMRRMQVTLDAKFALTNDSFPQGKVDITYDLTSDPQKFETVFKDNFSFGDGDNPFSDEKPTLVMRSGNENYLHFYSEKPFIKDDDPNADATDPFHVVQFCTPEDIYIKDIAEKDRLANPSTVHMQMIWNSLGEGQTRPSAYIARVVQSKGGAFIYGDTFFEGAEKEASQIGVVRMKAPRCAALTDTLLAMKGAVSGGVFLNPDGFINAEMSGGVGNNNGGDIAWISSKEALAKFPAFNTFKFVDTNDPTDSPLGKSGSAAEVGESDLSAVEDKGYCRVSEDLCYAFEGLALTSLTHMRRACLNSGEGGFGGEWSFTEACDAGTTRRCVTTDFIYGDQSSGVTVESVETFFYSDSALSSQNLCSIFGGTITPPLAGSCNSPAMNSCHSYSSIPLSVYSGLQAHCAQTDNGGFNGTWSSNAAACTDTGLVGTCSWIFNYGSAPVAMSTKLYGNVGPFSAENYCETMQQSGGLGGTYTPN